MNILALNNEHAEDEHGQSWWEEVTAARALLAYLISTFSIERPQICVLLSSQS